MTPSLLHDARKANGLTLDQLANIFQVTKQRVFQWESGDPIPEERLQAVAANPEAPLWLRQLALNLWHANIKARHARLLEEKRGLQIAIRILKDSMRTLAT